MDKTSFSSGLHYTLNGGSPFEKDVPARLDCFQLLDIHPLALQGGKTGLLIRKHDHFTPTREIRQGIRALTEREQEPL